VVRVAWIAAVLAVAFASACKSRVTKRDAGARASLLSVDAGVPAAVLVADALAGTSRFVSVAELRAQPLFAAFAEFVDTEDDLEESASDSGDDEDAELSPDRPPSDVQLTRLAVAGEAYLLSYEENCGDGLEDLRNLSHAVIHRRDGALEVLQRVRLCGESRRGFAVDVVRLTAAGPELVVRSWIVDPDGASEHFLRAYRGSPKGLSLAGEMRDVIDGAVRFDVTFHGGPRGLAIVDLGVQLRDDAGAERRTLRHYRLDRTGFAPHDAPPRR
jgi:hypothetical protein